MQIQSSNALRVAFLLAIASLPAAAQVGGFGGIGGFGGMASGVGFGDIRPDVPSVRPWVTVSGSGNKELDVPGADKFVYGSSIAGGVSASRSWARTAVVASYAAGGFLTNPFQQLNGANGISHGGGVQVMHQVSQRMSVSLSGFGGSSNGGFGVAGGFGGISMLAPVAISPTINPSQGQVGSSNINLGFQNFANNGLVDNEIFNTRVNFTALNAGVSYTPDGRNMFSFNVGASRVRRALDYLAGMDNLGAGASYSRMLNPKLSTGVGYSFGQFSYPGYYGGNRIQNLGWSLGYQINPATSLSVFAGGFQYQVNGIGTVTLPPQLASILGQSQLQQVVDIRRRGLSSGAALTRSLRVGSAGISYNRGANPGNGLLFATQQETVSLSYSVGTARTSLGTVGFFSRGKSLSSISGNINNRAVIAFFATRLLGGLHFTANAGQRWVEAGTLLNQRSLHVSAGLAFSPGAFPLWF
jgi:hypothetical protein